MDFDSPDVAKEFPGLAKALNDTTEYEDGDKKKKKDKDKKEKKEKEKGYAALDEDPDEDVGDSKSPGKVSKIFSIKKKDKDKKSSAEKEQKEKKSLEKSKEKAEKKAEKKVVEKERSVDREIHRRPFDGSHRFSAPALGSSSLPCCSNTVVSPNVQPPTAVEKLITPVKSLNVFLNAPVPSLLKKSKHKDKESKKEKEASSSTASKVRLKLKRGSKHSLDEASQVSEPPVTPSHQLPEDPEVIAKDIRKHEALLELTHSQFKTGKKMSKKHEEQLWELQRTLTQLKRKLRSVNALSASFLPSHHASSSSNNPYASSSESEKSLSKQTGAVTVALAPKNPPAIPENEMRLDFTPRTVSAVPDSVVRTVSAVPDSVVRTVSAVPDSVVRTVSAVPDSVVRTVSAVPETVGRIASAAPDAVARIVTTVPGTVGRIVPAVPETVGRTVSAVPISVGPKQSEIGLSTEIQVAELPVPVAIRASVKEVTCPVTVSDEASVLNPKPESPEEGEILETLQVEVEVHQPVPPTDHPTPDDLFEREIESFDMISSQPAPSDKRQNVDIIMGGKDYLGVKDTPVSLTSRSEPTLGGAGKGHFEGSDEDDEDESGDYVILRADHKLDEVNSRLVPAFRVIQAPSIFDPFSLPLFRTDEFIAMENESLISFNQRLQDDIVREEEEIEALLLQIQELTLAKADEPVESDLDGMDDDELVNLWQTVKFENDTLNEQVMNLKTMVATSRLEEFRLETRLKYLQDFVRAGQDEGEESESLIPEGSSDN